MTEDGADARIWDQIAGSGIVDKMNRKIVHFRWVELCIKMNEIVDDCNQMHLLPLP